MSDSYLFKLKDITTFIFDVDGVMTDGRIILTSAGDQQRTMNIKDGFALQFARKQGYKIAVISGGKAESIRQRFVGLGIHDVYLGIADKIHAYKELCDTYNIKDENVLYMGDDIPDYEVMSTVGFPAAPNNACEEIKNISVYISPYTGGNGCVRDVIEQVLKAQDKWFDPAKINDKDFKW
ncbi:MAG: KdsC family phosphatase [Flavobacteriales bacterium]